MERREEEASDPVLRASLTNTRFPFLSGERPSGYRRARSSQSRLVIYHRKPRPSILIRGRASSRWPLANGAASSHPGCQSRLIPRVWGPPPRKASTERGADFSRTTELYGESEHFTPPPPGKCLVPPLASGPVRVSVDPDRDSRNPISSSSGRRTRALRGFGNNQRPENNVGAVFLARRDDSSRIHRVFVSSRTRRTVVARRIRSRALARSPRATSGLHLSNWPRSRTRASSLPRDHASPPYASGGTLLAGFPIPVLRDGGRISGIHLVHFPRSRGNGIETRFSSGQAKRKKKWV